MTLADMDGDGNLDVVLGSSQSGEIRLAINDGSGTMRPPTQPLTFRRATREYTEHDGKAGVAYQAFADFNNSGQWASSRCRLENQGAWMCTWEKATGTFKHTASSDGPDASLGR